MKHRWLLPSVVAFVGLLIFGLTVRNAVRPPPLNVIFLTVESWRADSMRPDLMPELFHASRSGTRFLHHRAVSGWTAPNIIGLLTGLSPFEQQVHARGQAISADHRHLLEELSDEGWLVAGLQAFMKIDVFRNLGLRINTDTDLLPWLSLRAQDRQSFVLWYHYTKTHLPYSPAAEFRRDYEELAKNLGDAARERMKQVMSAPVIPAGSIPFDPQDQPAIEALYRGGIAEFDSWFGRFWRFFDASGLRDTTILIITADHGEELLERGEIGHASTTRAGHLHEEIVRVPMIIWVPGTDGNAALPATVDIASDHLDIVRVLRTLIKRAANGTALESRLVQSVSPTPNFAATSFGGYAEKDPENPAGFEASVVEGRWKLRLRQAAGGPVIPILHNLHSDPDERSNVAPADAGRVRSMSQILLPKFHQLWAPARSSESPNETGDGNAPTWVVPPTGGIVHYADVADGVRLRWTGAQNARYVIEYSAGNGPMRMDGRIEVTGVEKDFGVVDEDYWRTWIVPYDRIRIRIVPVGREDLASDRIEITVRP